MSDDDEHQAVIQKRGPKQVAVAAEDDDDDEASPAPIGRRGAPHRQESGNSDESDGDDDKPAVRHPKAHNDDSDESGSDDDAGAPTDGAVRQVALWVPINYDDMTDEDFEKLLKSKTRAERTLEKKDFEERRAMGDDVGGGEEEPLEQFTDHSGGYTYSELLTRVLAQLRQNNPELGEGASQRIKLPVPKIEKNGKKKTALTNFRDMAKAMGRPMEDVKDFIEKHLTTQGSLDANDCLILKYQNMRQPQVEAMFNKYIEQFVRCNMCGKIETDLTKDASSRLWVLKCRRCKASRTVQAPTNATYQAQTTKRAAIRRRLT